MTRIRKTVGRISFVGAGPGDPGLLTRRAEEALRAADHIVYDRDLPESLLGWVRSISDAAAQPETGDRPAEAPQFSPAEGVPGDVAKVLLSAARSGLRAVHLVAGDPFEHDAVVKEAQAVARTAVPFEVVPGVSTPAGVATYAGVALTGVRTTIDVEDVHSVDFDALATAVPRGLAMTLDAGDLAAIRDGLLAAGVDGTTAVSVTGDGTGDTQYTPCPPWTASWPPRSASAAGWSWRWATASRTARSSAGGRTVHCTGGRCSSPAPRSRRVR
jgi:uroporphyrinogen III methyltransferase/synthase